MADPYADTNDVEISLGRPLSDTEVVTAEGLLLRVQRRIERRITDLGDKVALDPDFAFIIAEVEADAVARVLRNPEGLLSEQDGDYLYTRDRNVSSGVLDLSVAEWGRLGLTSGAFTIAPYLDTTSLEDPERVWISTRDHL